MPEVRAPVQCRDSMLLARAADLLACRPGLLARLSSRLRFVSAVLLTISHAYSETLFVSRRVRGPGAEEIDR